jgi:eukaryotic-like serine/threonine-protein kinase
MDGLNLFLQVKNSPITRHIPFIFLTTTNDVEMRVALLEIGVEDYWNKPFDVREVSVRAKRILDRINRTDSYRETRPIPIESQDDESKLLNNRYRLLEVIGEGGMGLVYRALDLACDRIVALKLLRNEYVTNESQVRRFAREASTAMRIVHPNVIAAHEYGLVPSGQAYITMEMLAGTPLDIELQENERLSIERVSTIMRQVFEGVAEAHKQGVIHRDLKPSNIFLIDPASDRPTVKVLDFGIALLKDKSRDSKRITEPNIVMGTPEYISPEQAVGLPADERSDIYALGIVMFELLAGDPPFLGNPNKVVFDHVSATPKPIQEIAKVDSWLAELIMKMLSKKPEDRPQSVEEILNILNNKDHKDF